MDFNSFLLKENLTISTPSNIKKYNTIGWWKTPPTYLFHGTRTKILESIIEYGGLKPTETNGYDRVQGKVFLTPDPYTARGYSVMGGEYQFKTQKKPSPEKYGDRVVLVFKFDNLNSFVPSGRMRARLENKELYDEWVKVHGNQNDFKYYELAEVYTNRPVGLNDLVEIISV